MKNHKGSALAWAAGAVAVAVLGAGAYYFATGGGIGLDGGEGGNAEGDLASAKERSARESRKLADMTKGVASSSPLYASAFEAFAHMDEAVRKTDVFFDAAVSGDPRLKMGTAREQEALNASRSSVNRLLAEWRLRLDATRMFAVNGQTIDSLRRDAATVQAYIDQLMSMADNLTPRNSSLSQIEINAYALAAADAAASLEAALAALPSAQQVAIAEEEMRIAAGGKPAPTEAEAKALAEQQQAAAQAASDVTKHQVAAAQQSTAGGGAAASSTASTTVPAEWQGDTRPTRFRQLPDIVVDPSTPRPLQGSGNR